MTNGTIRVRGGFSLVALLISSCATGVSPQAGPDLPARPSALETPSAARPPGAPFDLVVRHGKVLDGSGNDWFYGDVGIQAGRVAAVGDLSEAPAATEIDATGLVVAPGFIDAHTHADDSLFDLPYAENFLRDGVTTLITGNCGGSVRNIGSYLHDLETSGVAINVATLVGHNTILNRVGDKGAESLSPSQMEEAKRLVREAMLQGAIGFSTGLIYTPGKYSTTEEIVELQKEAARYGGLYATHMRSEGAEILSAIDEALRVGREAGCRVEISHFKVGAGTVEGGGRTIVAKVLAAREQGQEVWLDQYPYTASSTGISVLFPDWLMEKGGEEARKTLQDPEGVTRVLADMKDYHEGKRKRTDFDWAVLSSCRAYPKLSGNSLQEAAERFAYRDAQGENSDWATVPRDRLPKVSLDDVYRAIIEIHLKGGASCVYHSIDEADVVTILQCPLVSIGSDSGVRRLGSGNPHPRGFGTNARVLGVYVREKKVLRLEEAIRKMTSLPALEFRLADRGLLRPGYWADITIFDPATVIDKATFENPHQYPEGISWVIVNGEPVVAKGELTGKKPGKPIYGPAWRKKSS